MSALTAFARSCTLLVCSLGLATGSRAQDTNPIPAQAPLQRDLYWLSAGLGAGSEDFAGHAALFYQHRANFFALRASATAGLFDDGIQDVALLYGRAHGPRNRWRLGLATGVALVDGCIEPGEGSLFGNCDERPTVVGVPVDAQVVWLPSQYVGLGLHGFADFNSMRSFGGVTLSLQLGRVR